MADGTRLSTRGGSRTNQDQRRFRAHRCVAICLVAALLMAIAGCTSEDASPAAECDQIDHILQAASPGDSEVVLSCSLKLPSNSSPITKRLVVEGSGGSGVTIDCNGATIDGSNVAGLSEKEKIKNKRNMVHIRSKGSGDLINGEWNRPTDVTVKNCNVIGGIRMEITRDLELIKNSSFKANHTQVMQRLAPKRITLDNLTITARDFIPVYFEDGVTESKLINSKLIGKSIATTVYLDAESSHNLLKNNEFHTATGKEVLAIDASSGNRIINNYFSALNRGGIYLYRNCGEDGIVRHTTPRANEIINNVFYYDKYRPFPPNTANPSVYLGSRNRSGPPGDGGSDLCDDDDGHLYGSSLSNRDFAQHNVVMQNQIYKLQPIWMIKEGSGIDKPNYIDHNTSVDTHVSRPAGCFIGNTGNNAKSFIVHGDSANGLTCRDGDLTI